MFLCLLFISYFPNKCSTLKEFKFLREFPIYSSISQFRVEKYQSLPLVIFNSGISLLTQLLKLKACTVVHVLCYCHKEIIEDKEKLKINILFFNKHRGDTLMRVSLHNSDSTVKRLIVQSPKKSKTILSSEF